VGIISFVHIVYMTDIKVFYCSKAHKAVLQFNGSAVKVVFAVAGTPRPLKLIGDSILF